MGNQEQAKKQQITVWNWFVLQVSLGVSNCILLKMEDHGETSFSRTSVNGLSIRFRSTWGTCRLYHCRIEFAVVEEVT